MSLGSALIGWKGYLLAVVAGAVVVTAVWGAFELNGAAQFRAGRQQAELEAAANARQIDAQYRRREQATYADFMQRLEVANDAVRISNDERDRARADAGGMLDDIAAQRTRAAQAAARAGLSEQSATRAWDLLKACTGEYVSLAADADRVIDGLRPADAWAKAAAGVR
ncbi:hypothetical protein [Achromobacter dolens]|uniref:hypothetical protein n=1 Tax=Achromobacter dolens TaxID=1287738 RepID=UPI00300CCC5D